MDNVMWQSSTVGIDTIGFDYTSDNYIVGIYYIAVYAYSSCSFSITANVLDLSDVDTNPNTVTSLFDGVPQIGLLTDPNTYHYYTFNMGETGDLTISVTPQYGDPDLFVTSGTDLPTNTIYEWYSEAWGRDTLTITDGCNNCLYTIGVMAYTHTLYSITASSTASANVLQLGIPQQSFVSEDQYQYFRVDVSSSAEPLVLSVTAVTGDPDLYVSMTNQRPTTDDYTWYNIEWGSGVLTLDNPAPGTYYIGVYGWLDSSFVLSATQGDVTLIAGHPIEGLVEEAGEVTYRFHLPSDGEIPTIVLSLDFIYGESYMYVGTTRGTATWSSENVGTSDLRNTLTIDSESCADCTYYVTVVGTTRSAYTITLTWGDQSVLLVDGQPRQAHLDSGTWMYFYSFVDSVNDISIDLTSYLGSVEMYVSTTMPTPSAADSTWVGSQVASGSHLFISTDDANFLAPAEYYIAVHASTEARFSLTLSTGGIMLRDGTPVTSSIPNSGAVHYFFYADQYTDLRLNLGTVPGTNGVGSFDVYVSTSDPPDADNYMWYKRLAPDTHMVFLPTDPNYCFGCTYYITVTGLPESRYTMTFVSTGAYAVVLNEQQVYGTVQSGEFQYYETSVEVAVNFTVVLESCTGNTNLYLSQDTYKPDIRNYGWISNQFNDVDIVDISDSHLTHAGFYLGVYGAVSKPSDYRLTVYSGNTSWDEGVPQPGNNGALSLEYDGGSVEIFFTTPYTGVNNKNLIFTLYLMSGNSDVNMYAPCGLERAFVHSLMTSTMSSSVQSFVIDEANLIPGESYKANIMVKDSHDKFALYNYIEFVAPEDIPGDVTLLLTIGIPLVLLLVVAVVYLACRNRKLTQELEVEMGAVPKKYRKVMTSEPSEASSRKENFARLLTDDNDDDVGFDYRPPATV
jgi:hypothetical protein